MRLVRRCPESALQRTHGLDTQGPSRALEVIKLDSLLHVFGQAKA